MKTRISLDLTEEEIFDLVMDDENPDSVDEDYHDWLDKEGLIPSNGNLADFCKAVVLEYINSHSAYQSGDNQINMTAAVYNHMQGWYEEEYERGSSRANL